MREARDMDCTSLHRLEPHAEPTCLVLLGDGDAQEAGLRGSGIDSFTRPIMLRSDLGKHA